MWRVGLGLGRRGDFRGVFEKMVSRCVEGETGRDTR